MEQWKSVEGYEGLYEVSDQGRVKSLGNNKTRKDKILKQQKHRGGYLKVSLCKDGHLKQLFVHRIVAKAFIQNPNNLKTVNHKDEVKTNNVATNLEWMTQGDNVIYSQARQVQMFDKSTCELLATFPSTHEAARVTGINQGDISSCCRGKLKSAGGYKWRYLL